MVKYTNSPDDARLKEYFDERDKREFVRNDVLSRRKLAKCSNYKCRVCKQSLIGEEPLIVNQIVPKKLGGDERYANLELLHQGCQKQHQKLFIEYGGGKDFPRICEFYDRKKVEFNTSKDTN